MQKHRPLPPELGASFSVTDARRAGVASGRLRSSDLSRPFHGVRAVADAEGGQNSRPNALRRARLYRPRMRACEFFSHETAALIWGAPLPDGGGGTPHVSVFRADAAPRARGVHGHRVSLGMVETVMHNDLRVTSPASTWAMLAHLTLFDLVAVGDFFARIWREDGYFRPNAGTPPLATITQLSEAALAGKRSGIRNLRLALPLIRTDSWSRTETWTRLTLTAARLPEPALNTDQYDDWGVHLGCVDLAYPRYKIAIEYQGEHHAGSYGRDIERVEALRAAGWHVIQVTARLLFTRPDELVHRVRNALLERGWRA